MERMRASITLAGALCLAGCGGAESVSDLRATGKHVAFSSSLSPKKLAICMQRNLAVSSEWAYLPEVDEFMVTNVNNGGVNANIEIHASDTGGSIAELYHIGGWFSGHADNVVQRVTKYCL